MYLASQASTLLNTMWNFMFLLTNRQEAAGALWNLSFDDKNREAIAAAGGITALVRHCNCTANLC
jgi:hypothetical protein